MNWSNNVATALVVTAVIVSFAGGAAGFAILIQIVRQGGWKLAERSIIKARWQMIRPWLFVGAGVGLLFGIGIVLLYRIEPTPAAAPQDAIASPLTETKSRPPQP